MANRMVIRYVSIIPGTGMMMKKNILAQWQAELAVPALPEADRCYPAGNYAYFKKSEKQ